MWVELTKEAGRYRESMFGARVLACVLLAFHLCLYHVVSQETHPGEVSAMKSIKRSLIDPMNYLRQWKNGDPCASNWTGVICFSSASSDGFLHVQHIQLLNMNLSGTLSPKVGQLTQLETLDFMWNQLTGSIPKEIGNISSLKRLLLNGNKLSGNLPEELGSLYNLNRFQIDENNIIGPIPKSYGNMIGLKHIHFNNNSISGQLPRELSQIPSLLHLLVDNNNLSGYLPAEFSDLKELRILQLDHNNFSGAEIPVSYGNLTKLAKLSLRDCSLSGTLPELSLIPELMYIDLSWNQLTGSIPWNRLSDNMTTIDLSKNNLNGSIPAGFSGLPLLQMLSLQGNNMSGSIPDSLWQNKSLNATARLTIDLRDNSFSNITGDLSPFENVNIRLGGNPVCDNTNILDVDQFCGPGNGETDGSINSTTGCPNYACPFEQNYEYVPGVPDLCFCAAPVRIGYRLKSPSLCYFAPYIPAFIRYETHSLDLEHYQVVIDSFVWESGPRLRMYLKIFPTIDQINHTLNETEVRRLNHRYASWDFPSNNFFGPYELLNFSLQGPYKSVDLGGRSGDMSKGVLAAIVIGTIAATVIVSIVATHLIMRRSRKYQRMLSKHSSSKISIKVDGVKEFSFKEMRMATDNFNSLAQVGRGGYGKVYKGILSDNAVVAIKRAEEGSLQGKREFMTEIQLLSRLHHRNLVSLVGYCGETGEQMLVYEFMRNGTLRDWLSDKRERSLSFGMRLRIALGSAKGILYLHTEANPPIFHRDIKASNILLDPSMTAKVADFGLSRLAPILDDDGSVPDHVSTVVKGTPGYLDPEYFLTHKLTDKSDVYSLGVVFLELLTGMHAITHGKNLVREVNRAQQAGTVFSIIDTRMGTFSAECVERLVHLAVRCCDEGPEKRPSMLEVVRELEDMLQLVPDSLSLSEPTSLYSGSLSSEANISRFTHMSSDISGSDLTTEMIHPVAPR